MAYEDFEDYSEKVKDTDYYNVIIPDLDPGTNIPVQFRWQYLDKTFGGWSAGKMLEVPKLERPESTNIVAVWEGTNLKISWEAPPLSSNFTIYLTSGARTVPYGHLIDKSTTAQFLIISAQTLMGNFEGVLPTALTGLLKTVYIDTSTTGQTFTVPPYSDGLNGASIADADWVVTQVDDGYSVSWTKPNYPTYLNTSLYKSNTINGTYSLVRTASEIINIIEANTVFVKIQHNSITGSKSAFSNAKEAKKYVAVVFDVTPPDSVVSPSGSWSGANFVVSFTMPASNVPSSVKVYLTNSTSTNLPTALTRFFEKTLSTSTGGAATSVTITRDDLINQFGFSPTQFTSGYVTALDAVRNENTTQVTISGLSSAIKPNLLAGKTTTISVSPMSNGYVVTSTFDSNAQGISVYWSLAENGTYALAASSATSPVIVYDAAHAGTQIYVKAKWTSETGEATFSAAATVTPLSIADISLIANPVKIATDGSIFTGNLNNSGQPIQSGSRIFFNREGIFVYDSTNTSPTTQIIGNAANEALTFITTRGQIANWIITPDKIVNQLTGTNSNYTGISASGTYAFYAGSAVIDGYSANANDDAKFSVTPAGAVNAKNIKITGGELNVGGKFIVNTAGNLTANDASLTGNLTVDATGIFKQQVSIGDASNTSGKLQITGSGGTVLIGQGVTISGAATYGITATASGVVQFSVNGATGALFSQLGAIGGWTIGANTLVGGNLTLSNTGAITNSSGTFSVTAAGKLTASGAEITGTLRATDGYIGNSTNGWTINGSTITSTGTGITNGQITLNANEGSISGGLISGTKISGSAFFLGAVDNTSNYLKSDGSFSLGSGTMTYSGSGNIFLNGATLQFTGAGNTIYSDDNNYGGDSTVVLNANSQLTRGRAFHYGGTSVPSGSDTSRAVYNSSTYTFNTIPFIAGDIWMTVD